MTKLVQEQGWKSDGQMADGQVRRNEGMLSQSSETNHTDGHADLRRGTIKLLGTVEYISAILAMAEMGAGKGLNSCHIGQQFNAPELPATRDTYNFVLPDGKRLVRVTVEAWANTPPEV